MLRNLCDAHRMLCQTKYHPKNKCKYCEKWNFNKICRDRILELVKEVIIVNLIILSYLNKFI